MAADIVKGADLARAVAHHDDRFGADLVGEEVARPRHLEGIADENPVAMKNPCQIGLENLGRDVKIALQWPAGPVLGDQAGNLRRDSGWRALTGVPSILVSLSGEPTTQPLPGPRPMLRFCEALQRKHHVGRVAETIGTIENRGL